MLRYFSALALLVVSASAYAYDPQNFDDLISALGNQIPFPLTRFQKSLLNLNPGSNFFQTTFPHGRSLERRFTDFSKPRSVMGWQSNEFSPNAYMLFMAYTPRREELEIIAWNWKEHHFDFKIISDYADGKTPRVTQVPRPLCVACHQGEGPIFPVSSWGETLESDDVLRQMKHTADLEPFAQFVLSRNLRPGGVETDSAALDGRVRNADALMQNQKICATACGTDLECRKEQLFAGVLYLVDSQAQYKYYHSGNHFERFSQLLSKNWPQDNFEFITSNLPVRDLGADPFYFTSDQDPLMPRQRGTDAHPDGNTAGELARFGQCLDLTSNEIRTLKSFGARKIEAAINTQQVAELAAKPWQNGREIVAAFSQAISNPEPEQNASIQVEIPSAPTPPAPTPYAKNASSPELFKNYCTSCHGGTNPLAPALPLGSLKALHVYVGSAGRTVQTLLDPADPIMPPIGAKQPTREERAKMLRDLVDAQ